MQQTFLKVAHNTKTAFNFKNDVANSSMKNAKYNVYNVI